MHPTSSRAVRTRAFVIVVLVGAILAACGGSEDGEDCVRAGTYSRGKEGGPSCCPGFDEFYRTVLVNQGTPQQSCEDPVGFAAYGCIEGECGDGLCELGEQGPCGCDVDCAGE